MAIRLPTEQHKSGNCREPSTAQPSRTRRRGLQSVGQGLASGRPRGSLVAGQGEHRGARGRWHGDRNQYQHRSRRGEDHEMAEGATRATLPVRARACGRESQAYRRNETSRECDGRRSRGPDGHAARRGAHLGGGRSRLLLRLQAEAGRHAGLQRDAEDLSHRAWGVVEVDCKSYCTSMPHRTLMTLSTKRIADGRRLKLIKQTLKGGVHEKGQGVPTQAGGPPGSPISPFYSNISLNLLDQLWQKRGYPEKLGATLHRYADEAILGCRKSPQPVLAALEASATRMDLTLTVTRRTGRG